jgi:hypothetical protein
LLYQTNHRRHLETRLWHGCQSDSSWVHVIFKVFERFIKISVHFKHAF